MLEEKYALREAWDANERYYKARCRIGWTISKSVEDDYGHVDVDVDSRQTISLRALAMALLLKANNRFASFSFSLGAYARMEEEEEEEEAAKTVEMKDMTFMKLHIVFTL